MAGEHARAYLGDGRARVVAVAGRDRGRTTSRARELGLDAVVHADGAAVLADPDVEAVSICTPHVLHAPLAIAAARAGKHVLVEKPIALNLEELRALRDAVRASGVVGMASFVLRWNPMLLEVKRRLTELGALSLARVDYWNRTRHGPDTVGWWHTRAGAGSALLHGGCHAVDTLRWLVGSEAVEVHAMGTSRHAAFDYPPTIAATVRFADGTLGQLTTCMEGGLPYAFNVDLIGERGAVRNARLTLAESAGAYAESEIAGTRPDSRDVSHHPFPGEIGAFLKAIATGETPPAGMEDAVRTHELCLAADISAAEGRAVRLPLLP